MIPTNILSELNSLLGLANQVDKQIEYWREYKGEEVIIRKHNVQRIREKKDVGPTETRVQQTTYLVRGEVEDVMSFPRGFRLRNVTEYVVNDDYRESVVGGNQQLSPKINGTHNVREINRKFVSFDSIEELEWAEDAEEETRPVREEHPSV